MPDTQDYRDETGRLFPGFLRQVAVASAVPEKYPLLVQMRKGLRYRWDESLRRDFTAQGVAADPQQLTQMIERAERDDGIEGPRVYGGGKSGDPASYFFCIFPLLKNVPVQNAFTDFSMMPPRSLDPNKIGMPRDVFEWAIFYHELGHVARRLLRPEKENGRTVYDEDKEEAICDAFAVLCMIGKCGEKAVPHMEAYADMRLMAGNARTMNMHDYFTASAVDKALFFARHIGAEKLKSMRGEDMFSLAEVIGTRAYLNEAQHSILAKRERPPFPPKIKKIVAHVFAGNDPDDPQKILIDTASGRLPRNLSPWLEKVKTVKEKYTV